MSKVKIATTNFDEPLRFLYRAHENIKAFSVVFGVNHNNVIEVYTDQNKAFDNGTPHVLGIAQNNANKGDIVEVQNNGISKVRFFSRNIPVNTNIYLQKDSNGVCCLIDEINIEPYQNKNGKLIMIGVVLPTTQSSISSIQQPSHMIIDVSINIVNGHSRSMYNNKELTIKEGIYDYKTEYYYYDKDNKIVGPKIYSTEVICKKIGPTMYEAIFRNTKYSTLQNLVNHNGTYTLIGTCLLDDRKCIMTPTTFENDEITGLSGYNYANNGLLLGEDNIRVTSSSNITARWLRPLQTID
jgi:hypothetical protein